MMLTGKVFMPLGWALSPMFIAWGVFKYRIQSGMFAELGRSDLNVYFNDSQVAF